MIMRSV